MDTEMLLDLILFAGKAVMIAAGYYSGEKSRSQIKTLEENHMIILERLSVIENKLDKKN